MDAAGGGLRTASDLRWKLRQLAAQYGSQKQLATRLGVSESYLSDVLTGRRMVSATLAEKIGYRYVVGYLQVDAPGVATPDIRQNGVAAE